MSRILGALLVLAAVTLVTARPQNENAIDSPMPYEFEWKVDDEPSQNYYSHNEKGNEAGRVEGAYQVLLPDGRLMKISYYVDGDSGFVPIITFEKDARPYGTR